MRIKKVFDNQWFSGIVGSLIAALLFSLLEKNGKIELQYWQGCLILFFCFLLPPCVQDIYKKYRIRKVIKEFTYGCFGNSFSYKWEYVKSKDGIYGYEPVNIQIAESRTIPEDSTTKVFVFCHAIDEPKLKLLIKATVYSCVEKNEEIEPLLKYLYDTEKQ